MADIEKLRATGGGAGLTNDEVARLREHGIDTIDRLWARIAKDDNFNRGIHDLADVAKIRRANLIKTLADEGVREARAGGGPWLQQHAVMLFTLLLLVPLAALLGLVVRTSVLPLLGLGDPLVQQVVVQARGGLAAFHPIGDTDVAVKFSLRVPDSFSHVELVKDRYAIKTVPEGATLRSAHLSAAGSESRQLMSLPVRFGAVGSDVAAGDDVTLLFAPREPDKVRLDARSMTGAIVSAVERRQDGASIVVAVTPAWLTEAEPFLATSEVFVIKAKP